jgi:hypothetical protein
VEDVKSHFVPVPKIKKNAITLVPLRFMHVCWNFEEKRECCASHHVPAPCTIAMQIEEGNNASDEGE